MSDVREFVDDNREWLRQQAESDMPAAWVADQLLTEFPEENEVSAE